MREELRKFGIKQMRLTLAFIVLVLMMLFLVVVICCCCLVMIGLVLLGSTWKLYYLFVYCGNFMEIIVFWIFFICCLVPSARDSSSISQILPSICSSAFSPFFVFFEHNLFSSIFYSSLICSETFQIVGCYGFTVWGHSSRFPV